MSFVIETPHQTSKIDYSDENISKLENFVNTENAIFVQSIPIETKIVSHVVFSLGKNSPIEKENLGRLAYIFVKSVHEMSNETTSKPLDLLVSTHVPYEEDGNIVQNVFLQSLNDSRNFSEIPKISSKFDEHLNEFNPIGGKFVVTDMFVGNKFIPVPLSYLFGKYHLNQNFVFEQMEPNSKDFPAQTFSNYCVSVEKKFIQAILLGSEEDFSKGVINSKSKFSDLDDLYHFRCFLQMCDESKTEDLCFLQNVFRALTYLCDSDVEEMAFEIFSEFGVDEELIEEIVYETDIEYVSTDFVKYTARVDNPKQFDSYIKQVCESLAWKSLGNLSSDTEVVRTIHFCYSDLYRCTEMKQWYRFMRNRWNKLSNSVSLMKIMSFKISKIYEEIYQKCKIQSEDSNTPEELRKEYEDLMKRAKYVITKQLKTASGKFSLLKEAFIFFHEDEFDEKLDENPNIVGFPNGVYDLETHIFRNGNPADYISLSCGIPYKDYNWDDKEVKEVMNYWRQIYPDDSIRLYAQKVWGSCLEGGNPNKDFYNMIGENGDNGKTEFMSIMKKVFGTYMGKISSSFLSGRTPPAGAAIPDLADKKGKRIVTAEETDKGKANTAIIKRLTGNEDLLGRQLYGEQFEFKAWFKLFVVSNNILEAPASETAYWSRKRVIPHESNFVKKGYPEDEEEQFKQKIFPIIPQFSIQAKKFYRPMLWCLTQFHKWFRNEKIIYVPDKIYNATLKAKNKFDFCRKFFNSFICLEEKFKVPVDTLYCEYKKWFEKLYNRTPINQDLFIKSMSRTECIGYKPDDDGMWNGVKIIQKIFN